MNDKISVIVPVYNAERFIQRCADSILQQTHRNLELILVNDGSKDKSLELCQKIAAQDERVLVFNKKNGGAASARNLGLAHASGDYIGFCDADDFLDLDMYETLLSTMHQNSCDVIDCVSKVWDENGNLIQSDRDDGTLLIQSNEEAIRQIFLRRGNVSVATRIFRAEILSALQFPENYRVEDFFYTICILLRVQKNYILNKPFYNCTVSSNSVTRTATGSIYLDALYMYYLAIEEMQKNGISLPLEEEYYLLKMYYLLSISSTANEWKKRKSELAACQKDLRKHFSAIKRNPYLKIKERMGLYLACIDMRFGHLLYLIKSIGK